MNTPHTVLDFFAEIGQLKTIPRSGWWTVGITNGESVADHSFRCAVIGYTLAKMEKCDAGKVVLMCLFNDLHEARLTDLHKVAQRYFNLKEAEKTASAEQLSSLPDEIADPIAQSMDELWNDTTEEGIVARDADLLECMVQGKEYYEQGFVQAKPFYTKALSLLKTKSAQKLGEALETWDSREWCKKIVVMER